MSVPKRKREQVEWENEMEACLGIVSIGLGLSTAPREVLGPYKRLLKLKRSLYHLRSTELKG